ncbi:MAG: protocatechuate 3,4-dioxygenase [Betaproteobacteria bacterium RBG_16_66_20]|nr:MAG: protocatechuate 3,4-dioxygenase [Betaproteobacteria bacterium RBG_16_66_20]
MAKILGGLTTSHIPLIGKAIAQDLRNEPYWQPFFKGFPAAHEWLRKVKPDVAVVVYNDHGLNFFLDKMPTFAIGAAAEYRNADEGWGIPTLPPFRGEPDLSWHIIESVVAEEFDPVTCQEMLVDHGFTLPMKLFWPGDEPWPVRVVPVSVNTVQHPLPTPARCLKFGQAIGRAIASYPEDLRVVVIGTGGLSHQLDGTRAGFINKEFDLMCMDKIVAEPQELARYSTLDLVRLAGAQGVELVNWLVARGALTGSVGKVHSNYHIPISNTATGLLVLENRG